MLNFNSPEEAYEAGYCLREWSPYKDSETNIESFRFNKTTITTGIGTVERFYCGGMFNPPIKVLAKVEDVREQHEKAKVKYTWLK